MDEKKKETHDVSTCQDAGAQTVPALRGPLRSDIFLINGIPFSHLKEQNKKGKRAKEGKT